MNERHIAFSVLMKTESEGAYSNIEINKAFSSSDIDARGRAFITNIVYGVLQNKIRLDYIIGRFSKIPMRKITDDVKTVLRMGLYQLIFMDKVPEYAVVNESIKLVRKCKKASSSGFVNAILRGYIRDGVKYPKEPFSYLCTYYSYPEWLGRLFFEAVETDAEKLMASCNMTPPFTVRVNSLVISREKFMQQTGAKPCSICDDGVIMDGGFSVTDDYRFTAGFYYPQDEASMMPAKVLNPKEGETVIDVCAAPGGKTTHMAQLMNNKGKIFAFDIYPHKLKLIEDNASRLLVSIISPVVQDASEINEKYIGIADKVLVDAPCSGLGILRRKPEIKYARSPEDLASLAALQQKILETSAKYVRPGGELVYSTCTINPGENEKVIEKFLENNKDFELIDLNFKNSPYIKLFPHIHNTDGFFIAKIRRVG
ncbi:MAG: 16S rRNA (cytosine(967)-C(5))-methyltransferase RsmB [Clostridia bacterium]|nr:16S rRNA (cytosine(967)-C(5))-methyltransferase RsmB [Clostridia bacterium]